MIGSPDDTDRLTSAEILDLLETIEAAIQTVKLYVADALLQPKGKEGDRGEG